MPVFKIVWEFSTRAGNQFSEVYYATLGFPTQAVQPLPALLQARMALLHTSNTLDRIRASDVAGLRITANRRYNQEGKANPSSPPDTAGNTAWCTLVSNGGSSRKLALRGLPDDWILLDGSNGTDNPPADFKKALNFFFKQLSMSTYGIRRISPPGAGGAQKYGILSADGTTNPGKTTLTLDLNPAWAPGDNILIGKTSAKDLPGLAGRWQVLAAAGALVQIQYNTPRNLTVAGGQGYARKFSYQALEPFEAPFCAFDYYGVRKTKDAFSHSAGARRAVRLRHSV